MKKFSSFLLMISLLAVFGTVFTSCDKTKNPPTITVSGITEGATYYMGSVDTATIIVGSNDGSLVSLAIDYTGSVLAPGLQDIVYQSPASSLSTSVTASPFEFNSGLHNVTLKYVPHITAAGAVTLRFTVKDDNDKTAEKIISFTVAATPVVTDQTLTLGDETSATGSFGAAFTGGVFTAAQATSHYDIIDMIYYYDAPAKADLDAIYAPDDATIQTQTWGGAIDWSVWTPKNPTRFLYVSDTYDFANASFSDIKYYSGTANLTKADNLAVNQVYAFTTINNKIGLFKVVALSSTVGGTITIDVKICDKQ